MEYGAWVFEERVGEGKKKKVCVQRHEHIMYFLYIFRKENTIVFPFWCGVAAMGNGRGARTVARRSTGKTCKRKNEIYNV